MSNLGQVSTYTKIQGTFINTDTGVQHEHHVIVVSLLYSAEEFEV